MRYLFLALIPLLFAGCVVRGPYAYYPADPVIYYDDGYAPGYGHGRTIYKHGHGHGHYREYRH